MFISLQKLTKTQEMSRFLKLKGARTSLHSPETSTELLRQKYFPYPQQMGHFVVEIPLKRFIMVTLNDAIDFLFEKFIENTGK